MTNGELADRYLHKQRILGINTLNIKVYSDYDVLLNSVNREAKTVVLPEFITEIYSHVFEKATFSRLVINVKLQNMNNLFAGYSGDELTVEIAHPECIVSLHNCFKDVNSLKLIDMSTVKFTSVRSISKMFSGCKHLISIKMPDLSESNVNEAYGLFEECWLLRNIAGFNIDTSKIKSFDHMFYCCGSLQNLDSIHVDMSSATSAIYTFARSSAGLDILRRTPLTNIKDTRRIFNNCKNISLANLKEIYPDIPLDRLRKMV